MTMKKINYYIFYLIKDKNDYEEYCENDIYAYTDDKSLANEFKKTRKHEFFTMRTVKDINQSCIGKFAEEFPNGYLIKRDLKTSGSKGCIVKVPVVLTKNEYRIICTTEAFLIYNPMKLLQENFNPKIFKGKYYKALDILRITYIAKVRDSDLLLLDDDSLIQIDQLQIFLDKFGKLFIGRIT